MLDNLPGLQLMESLISHGADRQAQVQSSPMMPTNVAAVLADAIDHSGMVALITAIVGSVETGQSHSAGANSAAQAAASAPVLEGAALLAMAEPNVDLDHHFAGIALMVALHDDTAAQLAVIQHG